MHAFQSDGIRILEVFVKNIRRTILLGPNPNPKLLLSSIARVQEVSATYRTSRNPADRQDKRV